MVFLRQWTNKKVLDTLKSIGKDNIITNKLLIQLSKKGQICNSSLIRQRFKTLENACNEAGVKYKNLNNGYWTKKKIYSIGKELSKKYRTLTKKELYNLVKNKIICSPSHIRRRIGPVKDFFKEVGINYKINSYKDLYGEEGAQDKINKIKISNTKWNKEKVIKVVKQLFIKKQFKDVKEYCRLAKGNKNIPSIDVIRKYFGTYKQLFEEANIPYKNYYWNRKRIINSLKKLDEKYGPLCKFEINKIYSKKGLICRTKCIRDVVGSLNIAAKEANIKFIEPQDKGHPFNGKKGKTEKYFLKGLYNNKNIISQYRIEIDNNVYFLDAYDPINNIVYELDGKYHKYEQQKILDEQRDAVIKEELDCEIIRIKEY